MPCEPLTKFKKFVLEQFTMHLKKILKNGHTKIGDNMKVSFLKFKGTGNYRIMKGLGFDVYEIQKPEQVDEKIQELKTKEYNTVIITSELASFSQDIIRKYKNDNTFNIIITPSKNEKLT